MYHGTPMMETAPFCVFLEASVFAEVEGEFALALELNYSFDSHRCGGQFLHHRIDWNWIAKGMLVAVCVQAGVLVMVYVSFASVIHPAYSIFWTAARLSLAEHASETLYNIQRMTELQSWLVIEDKFRPWAYPPSTLFVLLPFAQLPFWASLVVWSGIGVALYFAAAYNFSRSIAAAALASASLSTAVVAFHGHFTNLVAAIILASLAILGTSPILAGALLGVAATIKPQILILAPLALLAGRHYSALISAIAVGTLVGGMSVIVFGVDMWLAWAQSLPTFLDAVRHNEVSGFGVTPGSMTWHLGLQGTAALVFKLLFGLTGVVLCWRVFRTTNSLPERLVAMIGGGFLVLPHAMGYELAILAPAAAMYVLEDKRVPADWCLAIISVLVLVSWPNISAWVATVFTLGVCYRALTVERSAAYNV
jgi:hypothetical protein